MVQLLAGKAGKSVPEELIFVGQAVYSVPSPQLCKELPYPTQTRASGHFTESKFGTGLAVIQTGGANIRRLVRG